MHQSKLYSRRSWKSIQLYARLLDHLRPLRDPGSDSRGELVGSVADDFHAQVGNFRVHGPTPVPSQFRDGAC